MCAASRGVTRLDGARGKRQVWRPHIRTWGLSKANLLLKKVLVTLLELLDAWEIVPTCYAFGPQDYIISKTSIPSWGGIAFFARCLGNGRLHMKTSPRQGRINHWANRANARGLALEYQNTALLTFHVIRLFTTRQNCRVFDDCV